MGNQPAERLSVEQRRAQMEINDQNPGVAQANYLSAGDSVCAKALQ